MKFAAALIASAGVVSAFDWTCGSGKFLATTNQNPSLWYPQPVDASITIEGSDTYDVHVDFGTDMSDVYMLLFAGYSPIDQEEAYYLMMGIDGLNNNDAGTIAFGTDAESNVFIVEYVMLEYDTTFAMGQQDMWALECQGDEGSGINRTCLLVQGQFKKDTIESDGTSFIDLEYQNPFNPSNKYVWNYICGQWDWVTDDTTGTVVYKRLPDESSAYEARPQVGAETTIYYGLKGGDEYLDRSQNTWNLTGEEVFASRHATFTWSSAQTLAVATATSVVAAALF